MFGLLIGAGVIYLLLGDLGEALILLAFAGVSVTITIVQETRSERVLEALRELTSPRALVLRGGIRQRIPGREVVRGDVIVLAEGDRVPADAVLLSAEDLHTDESLLTGESMPVRKMVAVAVPAGPRRPGGDDLPYVFSGTLTVGGHALAEVVATGARSEIGKIGSALGRIETEPPLLRQQTRRLVQIVAAAGIGVSVVAVLLYGLFRGSWLDGLLGGVALSMSMLPEEFPLVLTVFMVMGAWRISQARVLTRRAATIETLGAATVLCTDKTGTLTQNQMSIAELRAGAEVFQPGEAGDRPPPEALRALLDCGILACAAEPFDPMERAFHDLGKRILTGALHRHDGWRLARSYGLRPNLLALVHAWRLPDRGAYVVAAKGAPEAIAQLCRLDPAALAVLRRTADAMASHGMRVLGIAQAEHERPGLPESQRDFPFVFLGLVGLADPLRPTVPDAVRDCRSAGIRVVMITGDYPATARAIARQAGLDVGEIITGEALERMSAEDLARRIGGATIFARIMPEQKLRIVEALKASGEVVAMTGDGVNDAPSLKAAHIGIAMGGRGTDVAREAAAIVLLDDDFGSIVRTIRLGRRIYDNLQKAMSYILAVHVPIAGLSLLPLLFGWPLILGPVHIAFIEMVIDPVCSVVFEAEGEEADIMRRPPRRRDRPIFPSALVGWSLFQGALVFLLVAAIFVATLRLGLPEADGRAITFVSLVFTNMGLILVNRSHSASIVTAFRRSNAALWRVLAAATALLALIVAWPPARALFHFGPLHADDLAICLGAGVAVLVVLDVVKPLWRDRLTR
jgi:Ca2+-transporting ATPase